MYVAIPTETERQYDNAHRCTSDTGGCCCPDGFRVYLFRGTAAGVACIFVALVAGC